VGSRRRSELPPVAVFDAHMPPGIAFIRSLGRAGVPVTVYSASKHPAGRHSRFAGEFRSCPDLYRTDAFIEWLSARLRSGEIANVAPTSDFVAFNLAEAVDHAGLGGTFKGPSSAAIRTALFKHEFAAAMEHVGFPAPLSFTPRTDGEFVAAADKLGYPVVVKPRSHVGVGINRGGVAANERELLELAAPYRIGDDHSFALRREPDLVHPLVQQYLDPAVTDVVSVSGCLDVDGTVLAVGHSRKMSMWPPKVGIGTSFEWLDTQPFTELALDATQRILGRGVFELEVCINRVTGDARPIDLNPRGYGQISLEIARGNDLPALWYRSVTGIELTATRPPGHSSARLWLFGVPYYTGSLVGAVAGPDRGAHLRTFTAGWRTPRVGVVADRRDPLPGLLHAGAVLRHPRGLVRSFVGRRSSASSAGRLPQ
jgi:D-aspartate ligase